MKAGMELSFDGKRGTAGILSAKVNGEAIWTNRIDIADAKDREEFISKLVEKCPGADAAEIHSELEKLAGETADRAAERFTQSDLLVKLAGDLELFAVDDLEYATVTAELPSPHRETHRIREKGFRQWLQHRFFSKHGRATSTQSMQEAIETLSAKAKFGGKGGVIGIRICEFDGRVYLDLCDELWRVVEIDRDGWRIIPDPPVRFIRRGGMLALPTPTAGGKLDELRGMLNAGEPDTWVLCVGWIVGAMNPAGPFPILAVNGEQGSAKSTLCKTLRRLIDPNKANTRAAPRDDREIAVGAENSWVMCFDNLSSIRVDLSDALCRLSTGSGYGTRRLYSDDDQKLSNVVRPVMFNGIEDVANRSDLLERSIVIHLPTIPEHARLQDVELEREFGERHPRILGAILDAVSAAIRYRDDARPGNLPRMADFAVWVNAAERALGWPAGTFLDAYRRNRKDANQTALEASPVGQALMEFMERQDTWAGSASELLEELDRVEAGHAGKRDRAGWPTSVKALAGQVRRIAPNLRRLGLETITGERQGKDGKRIIRLEWQRETPSAPSVLSAAADLRAKADDAADGKAALDGFDRQPDRPHLAGNWMEKAVADGADAKSYRQSAYAAGL